MFSAVLFICNNKAKLSIFYMKTDGEIIKKQGSFHSNGGGRLSTI